MQFIALFFHEMEEELRFIFGCFDSIWEAVVRVVMSQRAHNLLNCVNVKAPTQSAADFYDCCKNQRPVLLCTIPMLLVLQQQNKVDSLMQQSPQCWKQLFKEGPSNNIYFSATLTADELAIKTLQVLYQNKMRSSDNGILKFHLAEINNTQVYSMMLAYVWQSPYVFMSPRNAL